MILFRYLSKELWKNFILILLSLNGLLLFTRFVALMVELSDENLTVRDYFRLLSYFAPYFLTYLLPLAALLAAIFLFMRLAQDQELLAFESLGIPFWKLLRPVAFLSVAALIATYLVTIVYLPWSKHAFRNFFFELAKRKIEKGIPPKNFVSLAPGLSIFVKKAWQEGKNFAAVFIVDETGKQEKGVIFAERGSLDVRENTLELRLEKGSLHLVGSDYSSTQEIDFEKYIYRIKLSDLEKKRTPSRGEMSLKELKQKALALPKDNPKRIRFLVEYYQRLSFPWAAFFLPFIGAFVGAMIRGSGRLTAGVLAIFLYLGYYFLETIGVSLAETKLLPPAISLQIPNIFLLIVCLLLIVIAKKGKIRPVK
ncbi:LptF/LptG family permease [Thermodesulfatator atlanticus]|uniref:LptF/LptG family permease n=1 Tax=Thermodesulfatator atlanticus TaxID=501497 RepID=UPI0003B3543E|nr:LptF/LptG family permease [Thermodesulfatator atlanticus]